MTEHTTPPEKTPPRPRGRPRLADGVGRVARIEWRTTQYRREKAIQMANSAGISLSAWLDWCIDGSAASKTIDDSA